MSLVEFTKNFSIQQTLATNGTLFQTMSLTLNGVLLLKPSLTPKLTALILAFLLRKRVESKILTKQSGDVEESGIKTLI
jgi:hypothetical protein